MTAVGTFLVFGAFMAFLAGVTLAKPGTFLDRIWMLNPRAYSRMAPSGGALGVSFTLLAGVLSAAEIGWFKYRHWGWRLAVAVIATQIFGDFVNVFFGQVIKGAIGVSIAGALLFYLLRPKVKECFHVGESSK